MPTFIKYRSVVLDQSCTQWDDRHRLSNFWPKLAVIIHSTSCNWLVIDASTIFSTTTVLPINLCLCSVRIWSANYSIMYVLLISTLMMLTSHIYFIMSSLILKQIQQNYSIERIRRMASNKSKNVISNTGLTAQSSLCYRLPAMSNSGTYIYTSLSGRYYWISSSFYFILLDRMIGLIFSHNSLNPAIS